MGLCCGWKMGVRLEKTWRELGVGVLGERGLGRVRVCWRVGTRVLRGWRNGFVE